MMQKPWKGAAGAGTHCWPAAQPAGDWSLGWQAMACVAHCGAGRTTDASGWQAPPVAVDPEIVAPTPLPHALVAVCTLVQTPGVAFTEPQAELQPPVPNCTLTEPHVAPEAGPHEQEHCAGSADRPVPPSKAGR
jgi:hypothetical protein